MKNKMKNKISIFLLVVLSFFFESPLWAIHWTRIDTGYSSHFHDIQFCDSDTGVIVGQEAILRTTDGGENWERVFRDANRTFYDVDGEGDILYALADWGRIYQSRNCGLTWERKYLIKKDLYSLDVVSAERPEKVVAVGPRGLIVRTNDGTSREISGPSADNFKSVYFVNDTDHGFIAAEHGAVLVTFDGGLNWSQLVSPGDVSLRRVFATSPADIFVTERSGNICASTWGGWAWRVRSVSQGIDYQSMAFGANSYRVAGSQGKIAASRDEGVTWAEEDSGTNVLLRSIIYVASAHRWFAVGNDGTLLRAQGKFIFNR